MELQELPQSPKFPGRSVQSPLTPISEIESSQHVAESTPNLDISAEASVSPNNTSNISNITNNSSGGVDGVEKIGGGGGDGSVSSSGVWLQFNPGDFLSGKGRKVSSLSQQSDSSSSPMLKATEGSVASATMVGSGGGGGRESHIEKADKVYTVAAKDIGMLERISQKAHDRALRIQEHHELFVELEELRLDTSENLEWAETARWIKFEEEVEEGSGRWGRPHISALAFHSLVELKRGLDGGCILLDCEGLTFVAVVDDIVSGLVSSSCLPAECAQQVRALLLSKHKHTDDTSLWERLKHSATGGPLRKMSTTDVHSSGNGSGSGHHHDHTHQPDPRRSTFSHLPLLIEESTEEETPSSPVVASPAVTTPTVPSAVLTPPPSGPSAQKRVSFDNLVPSSASTTNVTSSSHNSSASSSQGNSSKLSSDVYTKEEEEAIKAAHTFKRRQGSSVISKIPAEAESLTVLVGGVNFLKKPITAFVRLKHSLLHGELTEAPVPLRFIFLQIGPDDDSVDYHEVGRAMATLMSDGHFHEVAYEASSEANLIEGMDEFLDSSLVLPPGDWGEDLLLPALHERNNLRKRKEGHKEAVESYQKMVTTPMKHSRRPCGGMWHDLKNLGSRYISDFRDALTPQVFVSILFLYISFLAPAIAFGGLMEEETGNLIGETETLFATGLGGILYGFLAVQPMTVLAFTGPVIVFESIIFEFAVLLDLPYVQWRAAIGLWVMLMLLVLAVSELTFLVHHFTRFCEEVFIGVVAVFFIYEAGLNLFHIYERNPLCGLHYPCGEASHLSNICLPLDEGHHGDDNHSNHTYDDSNDTTTDAMTTSMMTMMTTMMMNETTGHGNATLTLPRGFRICNQPNTFLWSIILLVGTFLVALLLRKLRYKNFLGKKTRRLVSDFGMLTAITTMVLLAFVFRNLISVEVLLVLPRYSVSRPADRGWFINPFDGVLSIEAGIGAIIPAALLSILIFVENQLGLILVNKPENKLKKPVGYHLDLSIVAVLSGIFGVLGSPFLCAAPVRSLQHLQTLSVYTKKTAPGEKPRLLHVHEQRVATIIVHVLIVLTPFANVVLEVIPIPVVLGVFVYLSYVSILGVQLFTRIKLLFILPKHHPDVVYVRKVPTWKMHLYTLIQAFSVAGLYALKLSPAAMVYPLMIVLLIPLRWVLGRTLYTKEEIEALDNEENAKHGDDDEIGEFRLSHAPY